MLAPSFVEDLLCVYAIIHTLVQVSCDLLVCRHFKSCLSGALTDVSRGSYLGFLSLSYFGRPRFTWQALAAENSFMQLNPFC